MRKGTDSLRRYFLAFCVTCIIFAISIYLANLTADHANSHLSEIPVGSLIVFYGYMLLIQAMSILYWKVFSSTSSTLEQRTLTEAVIDTGLIAVGKYIPGKAMGILARGAVKDGSVVVSKASIATSASEQIYSLSSGLILVVAFLTCQLYPFYGALITVLLLIFVSYLPLLMKLLFKSTPFVLYLPCITPLKAFSLSLAYIVLWLVSSMPILTLIATEHQLKLSQILDVVVAFTGSIIAGWVAIFSPGGIGIREAAFAATAPEWLDWKEGLFWIMLHRTLCIFFDLVFGSVSIGYLVFELRRETEK